VGDNVVVGAQSGVINDVPDKATMIGAPAMPASQARRVYTVFTQLPELLERIRKLEQRVEELGGARE
jgi:UDP-3-O-[3-hydroxymyristoyl] glucosamine N-acyltransferase